MRIADEIRRHRKAHERGVVPEAGPPVLVEASAEGENGPSEGSVAFMEGVSTQRVEVDELERNSELRRVELMAALQDMIADSSQILELEGGQGKRLNIGRTAANDVVVQDPSVSARHAVVALGARVRLTDSGSANGTYINGRRLKNNEEVSLRSGDCIRFGRRAYYFLHGDRLVLFMQLRIGRSGDT